MVNFKQFLNEKPNYDRKIEEHMSKAMIPITDKISDVLGFGENTTCFHATGIRNLKNIQKLGKSKKTISCFTYGLDKLLKGGLTKTPDVLVKLEGFAMMDFEGDAFSHPDKQGRRWFSATKGMGKEGEFLERAILSKPIDAMLSYLPDDVIKDKLYQYHATNVSDLKEELIFDDHGFIRFFNLLTNTNKNKVIKIYIDNVTQLMENTTYSKIVNKKFKDLKSDNYGYNEIIVNKFKTLGVYALGIGAMEFHKNDAMWMIEEHGCFYLGYIPKEDFSKVTPETY